MSARPYHKRYHSDALAGFMSLTLEERGAYQTLLDLIYDRGGPVPENDRLLAGYMGVSMRKWRQVLTALLSKGKIERTVSGFLTNRRAEKEIENDAKTTRKLAENGAKGGRQRGENAKFANENNDDGQAKPKPPSSLPEAIVKEEVSSLSGGVRSRERESMPSPIEQKVMRAAGLTRPLSAADRQQLQRWRTDGIDLDGTVLPVLSKVAARQAATGQAIGTLKYCDQPVREEHARDQRETEHYREVAKRYGGKAG